MDTFLKILGGLIAVVGVLALIALLLGLPVMLLWNWLLPVLFGLKEITFAQAVGVNLLSGFLFKSANTSSK